MRPGIKLDHNGARRTAARSGFTMVEIALSLAVVAFALVAIIGILPTGMTVQKDNREDTIINQEGRYWLEAIRTGAIGLSDLTNYVEEIILYQEYGTNQVEVKRVSGTPARPWFASDIIGLLTTPKYGSCNTYPHDTPVTNKVVARVKAMTGSAAEKGPLTNEFSFRYEIESELIPNFPLPLAYPGTNLVVSNYNAAVGTTLHDIRLVLRWPVVQQGPNWHVGNSRRKFRGKLVGKPTFHVNAILGVTNWFVLPDISIGSGGGVAVGGGGAP